jgi:hypothetical protein
VTSNKHRSLLETDQKSTGVDSQSPGLLANPDGSCTAWFAPVFQCTFAATTTSEQP